MSDILGRISESVRYPDEFATQLGQTLAQKTFNEIVLGAGTHNERTKPNYRDESKEDIDFMIFNEFLKYANDGLGSMATSSAYFSLLVQLCADLSQSDYHEKDFLLKKVSKSLFIKYILEISSIYRTNFCEGNISMEGMDSLFSPIKRTDNTWSARYRNVMYW